MGPLAKLYYFDSALKDKKLTKMIKMYEVGYDAMIERIDSKAI